MIIRILIVIGTSLMLIMVGFGLLMSKIKKEEMIGKSTIHPVLFILAKIAAFICIGLLLFYGLNIKTNGLYELSSIIRNVAFVIYLAGYIITIITSSTLKKDLKFGLPKSEMQGLKTKGIFSYSRHPFYMGFLLIMLSSVIFVPTVINILCFLTAWILHHFIMINEEKFLISKFGNTYNDYMQQVRRYF